jgi:hypothetical protein
MRALVLFKGTGSVDRALEAAGFEVDSLDIDPACNATWTSDVLDWQAWRYMEPERYAFIWASPPCQQYSIARTNAKTPRDMEQADRVVLRTLEIISALKPLGWLMENPQTGYLRTRDCIVGLPFRDVCYCRYSDGVNHLYRKPTRLWGVLPGFEPRPMCSPSNPCDLSAATGRHPCVAQRAGRTPNNTRMSLQMLYSMPRALTEDIAEAARQLVHFRWLREPDGASCVS